MGCLLSVGLALTERVAGLAQEKGKASQTEGAWGGLSMTFLAVVLSRPHTSHPQLCLGHNLTILLSFPRPGGPLDPVTPPLPL